MQIQIYGRHWQVKLIVPLQHAKLAWYPWPIRETEVLTITDIPTYTPSCTSAESDKSSL